MIESVRARRAEPSTSIASTSACSDLERRRPDLLWVEPGKVAVVVEIDEDSHSCYLDTPSCEVP